MISSFDRTHRRLRQSEEKFRQVSACAQDAIIVLDQDGKVANWNAAAEKIFGYAAPEVIGQDLHELVAPAHRHEEYRRGYRAFRETGTGPIVGKTLELSAIRRDRSEFSIELSISALQIQGQWHAVGIVRDIRGRTRAEDALRHSESTLKEAERIAHIGHWELDLIRDLLRWSDEIYRIFEIDPGEFGASYESFLNAVHPEDRDFVNRIYTDSVRNRTPYDISHRLLMKDGRVKFVHERCETYYDKDGRPLRSIGTVQDITEIKQTERALKSVNRALKTRSGGNEALVHAPDEAQLLREMCRNIVENGGYRLAWIGLAEHDAQKTVRPVAYSGYEEGYMEHAIITWADTEGGHGPVGTAIRTRKLQVIQDVHTDPMFERWRPNAVKLGYGSLLVLPLTVDEGVLGALSIYAADVNAFDDEEIRLLAELADNLTFGIVALRTRTGHQRAQEALRASLEESIQAIAATVEKRDPYTAGHQRRAASLCVAIARELGLAENRIEGLHLAATIHDLGKIQIPAEILSKPARLTPAEFELIKDHPEAGYDIVKGIRFPWPIAQIILQHHEYLDGSGYPRGLKSDDILQESMILTVADVVEAMSSHRPYRPALGIDAALDEINRNRAIRYDAAVVDACIRLFREKGFGFE